MKTPFHYRMKFIASGMMAYVGHPTSWEMEIEGSRIQDQLGLHSKLEFSLGYINMLPQERKNNAPPIIYFIFKNCPRFHSY